MLYNGAFHDFASDFGLGFCLIHLHNCCCKAVHISTLINNFSSYFVKYTSQPHAAGMTVCHNIHALLHRNTPNIITNEPDSDAAHEPSFIVTKRVLPSGSKHASRGVISRTNQAVS